MASSAEAAEYPDLVEEFETFFRRYADDEIKASVRDGDDVVRIDWMELFQYDPDLAEDLIDDPSTILDHAHEALRLYDLPVDHALGEASIAVHNLQETRKVGDLSPDTIGSFVEVVGQAAKLSQRKPKPDEAVFVCERCGMENVVPQPKYEFQEPYQCQSCEREGPFSFAPKRSEWTIIQELRLKRSANETKGGRSPTLTVTLRGSQCVDLNDGAWGVGSRIGVSGVMDIRSPSGESATGTPVLRANAIEVFESDFEDLDIDADDRDRIKQLAAGEDGDPYEIATDTLAPTHHGDRELKEGVLLQMFAGVTSEYGGSTERGNIHILAVGDPGTGKSELMERIAEVAPNSRKADGKGASKSAITAAAVPSDFGDEKWDLEAGVLPLADHGVACIDEIDKADDEAVESLHGAMAQQTVKIDKADIHAELPARAAVLAAGNPQYGRFDEYESFREQLDLGPTILSRFDLIFPVRDEIDRDADRELAESITRNAESAKAADHGVGSESADRVSGPISDAMLTKWAAYARQEVVPTISDEQIVEIAERYVDLRADGYDADSAVPVTARRVDAIRRLAEASARVRLSDTVHERDIDRAMSLIRQSIEFAQTDDDGQWDADMVESEQSFSQHQRRRKLEAVIEGKQAETDDGAPKDEVVEMVAGMGYDQSKVEHDVAELKESGQIYEPTEGYLRWT